MSDKILFIDVSNLKKTLDSPAKAVFVGKDSFFCKLEKEMDAHMVCNALAYLELTQLQCQIIRDNIVEIIRFADT
jgi:hypothetical protein